MRRERLTPKRIRDFACPTSKLQAFLWDTESPHLAVRATAGSKSKASPFEGKSFVFEVKLNRQTIRRTIARCNATNLDDARVEANRLQTIIDRGEDPRELDREEAEAKLAAQSAKAAAERDAEDRQRYTLRALCNAYADHLESNGKTRSAGAARSAFKCHVFTHSKTAGLPAREVTARQMAEIVRKTSEAGKGRTAGVVRSYLCAAYSAAKKAPLSATLPAALIPFDIEHNPVLDVPAIPVRKGARAPLSTDELKAYLSHLGDTLADDALRIALLAGGQRMAQLLRATVADFDPDAETLRLFDAKGRRTAPRVHLLPLAPKAAAAVATLARRAKENRSKWLFAVRSETPTADAVMLAVETPGKRVTAISTAIGDAAFDLRDIRRTCETMLAGMGVSKDIRAQLLSHGISGVQDKHYDMHEYVDEKRAALLAWEAKLDEIAKGKKADAGASNVVKMKRRRHA